MIAGSAESGVAQRIDEELMDQLSPLVPSAIAGVQRTILLGSGRGALGQSYAILGLDMNLGWDWKVLLFTGGEFGWDLVAMTSIEGQRAWVPEVLYVPGVPGALVLTHVDGYGTGVFRRSTTWHRIAKGQPIPLLSYPQSFYVVGWGMPFDRHLTSRLLSVPTMLRPGARLELEFTARYTMSSEFPAESAESALFSAIYRLSMEWNDSAQVFVPHAPTDDFSIIDQIWGEATDGFVRRNRERLDHLARFGTERQQRFIQEHLLTAPQPSHL